MVKENEIGVDLEILKLFPCSGVALKEGEFEYQIYWMLDSRKEEKFLAY